MFRVHHRTLTHVGALDPLRGEVLLGRDSRGPPDGDVGLGLYMGI